MEKNQLPPQPTILDFGCGSGILGLAAFKMVKTKKVDFYDIDENSLGNTTVNLDLNQIKADFSLYLPKNRQEFLKQDAPVATSATVDQSGQIFLKSAAQASEPAVQSTQSPAETN